MSAQDVVAQQFEDNRAHLRGLAYRMLGSLAEAEDAVQEAWLRLSRSDVSAIDNLGGWLTTVVARVCLDVLRSRKSRREAPLDRAARERAARERAAAIDPEREMELADSVGVALLVVLQTLAPAERLAFVLHDMFGVPFEEIAPIVGRTPTATRKLASRARQRVQGGRADRDVATSRQKEIVDAFAAAAQRGDFDALVSLLDPDVVLRIGKREFRGATVVAQRAVKGGARAVRSVLVDGAVGVVVAPMGKLLMVLRPTFAGDKIASIQVVSNPREFEALELAVFDDDLDPS